MPKHKTVKKWVATLDTGFGDKPPEVRTAEWEVIETPKQFRLVKANSRMLAPPESRQYRLVLKACGYRTTINKERSDCPLHDTEKAALVALHRYYVRQLDNAKARLRSATADEDIVAHYLEQKYAHSDESNSTG